MDSKIDQDFAPPSQEVLAAVSETEPQVAIFLEASYAAAVIKLRNYDNTYLFVARALDPRVMAQLVRTPREPCRISRHGAPPGRRADRVRADVHGDRADRPSVGGAGSG